MSFHLNRFHLVVGTYPKELLPQITPIFLQQDLQVSEQDWTILRVAEAELDAGGNKAGGIAEVMANAIMNHNMDGVPVRCEFLVPVFWGLGTVVFRVVGTGPRGASARTVSLSCLGWWVRWLCACRSLRYGFGGRC